MSASVQLLLDEQLRGLPWTALLHRRESTHPHLIVTRVGDPPDLPLGTADPQILDWAERNGYVLVSADFRTMPGHFAERLAGGLRSAGLIMVAVDQDLTDALDYLLLVVELTDPHEWVDRIEFAP